MNEPKIGQLVHYVAYGTPGGEYPKKCRAAVITDVFGTNSEDGKLYAGVAVFNPTGMFFHPELPEALVPNGYDLSEVPGGTWHKQH